MGQLIALEISKAHLDGVNVVGDDDQRRLLVLNQGSDVVDSELDSQRLGALLGFVRLRLM